MGEAFFEAFLKGKLQGIALAALCFAVALPNGSAGFSSEEGGVVRTVVGDDDDTKLLFGPSLFEKVFNGACNACLFVV